MAALSESWAGKGWAYFKQGDLKNAERYLKAAWSIGQNAKFANLLGQVYQKDGQKENAIQYFLYAVSVNKNDLDARGRLVNLGFTSNEMSTRLAKAAMQLSEIRTVKLPKLNLKQGTAHFYLLFSNGPKLEKAIYRFGDSVLENLNLDEMDGKYPVFFPEVTPIKIYQQGIISCSQYAGCMLVFLLPEPMSGENPFLDISHKASKD
jgi:tetratricopeptide (TPR) repeat protein